MAGIGELQITHHTPGKPIEGKLFRPYAYETLGAVEAETYAAAVVIKLHPAAGDPDFKEPFVLLRLNDLENFIKAIRIAEAGLHPAVREGGTS
jgi:hypothetical protein